MRTSVRILKLNARKGLKGYWNPAVFCSSTFICAMIGTSALIERLLAKPDLSALDYLIAVGTGLILRLLIGLLKAGLTDIHFSIIAKENVKLSQIFKAFRVQPDRYLYLELILTVLNIIYLLLIVFGLRTAITAEYYVMLIPVALWAIVGGITLIAIRLTLALAVPLFLEDETLTMPAAAKKSAALMKGQRLRLLRLQLSYIGWLVPALTTSGISLFWTLPYLTQASCLLYREILDQRK